MNHPWDVSPDEARAIQHELCQRVITVGNVTPVHHVAGADVHFDPSGMEAFATIAVLRFSDLSLQEQATARKPVSFPYVPGLLSFREAPAILEAMNKLKLKPDLLLCDGQGIAHPRRFGIACHLGLLTDLPTIGVAKTRLTGQHGLVPDQKGAWSPLIHKREKVGAVLRTRVGVKPIYVSVGHKIGLEAAITLVMKCITRFRLPETTRWADRLAKNSAKAQNHCQPKK